MRCKRCHKDLAGEEYLDLDKAQVLSPNPDQPRDPRLTGKICISCDRKETQEIEEKQRKEQDTIKQKFSSQIEVLEKLKKIIGNPQDGASAYNTGRDKAWYDEREQK